MDTLRLVISGGQTGVDQAAWRAAKASLIDTGGTMPWDYWADDGRHPEFALEYGVVTIPTTGDAAEDLRRRTWANVQAADLVLWLGPEATPLFRATRKAAQALRKPFQSIPAIAGGPASAVAAAGLATSLAVRRVRTLMVAGCREALQPGIGAHADRFLRIAFHALKHHDTAATAGRKEAP